MRVESAIEFDVLVSLKAAAKTDAGVGDGLLQRVFLKMLMSIMDFCVILRCMNERCVFDQSRTVHIVQHASIHQ
jgi:hypothetical protein